MLWKCCTQYASKFGKQQWPKDWKRSVFIPIPKKGNAKECSNYGTFALISHASKVMLKILQARLQQYVNHEIPDVQAYFRKGRGTRDQIANIHWIMEKAREFQKNIYFCFIDYAKAFDCGGSPQTGKFFSNGNTRPPDLPPEKSVCKSGSKVTTGQGTTDSFQIRKGVHQGCKAGLDEAQAGIKIAERNINNQICRYHHPYGRKWRRTKEPHDERGEWKSWLKAQHSEN